MQKINDLKVHLEVHRERILSAMARVVDRGWVILGPEVEAFERDFARYVGAAHCVGVGNGTDALELALRAVGVCPGERVATAANAGMYSTVAIFAAGAVPLYLDVDPESGHLRAREVAKAIKEGARAVIATHLFGRMVGDLLEIEHLCASNGIPLIEDCAQAHGARLQGKVAGTYGTMGCFSFYPTKNLGAIGDAGAVVTDDAALAIRLRQLRQYGWEGKYRAEISGGRNSRLDEVQAAVLAALLPELDAMNERRRAIAQAYHRGICHPAVQVPAPGGPSDVAHLFVVRSAKREQLRSWLNANGIATEVHYPIPDHRQPALAGQFSGVELPHTERHAAEVLTLPCYPELAESVVTRIVELINAWPS